MLFRSVKLSSRKNISTIQFALTIGSIIDVSPLSLVQTLIPRKKEDSQSNTYSGNYGIKFFPMHTDLAHWYLPPRYLLLRCIVPAHNVATNIINLNDILKEEMKELVRSALFRPRRKLNNKMYLLTLQQKDLFRWDSIFLKPANKAGIILKNIIEDRIKTIKESKIFLCESGDSLLIDNWKVMHGRDRIPNNSFNRKIERIYLSTVKI